MADRFGGIPVEETPKPDRFGGIPVRGASRPSEPKQTAPAAVSGQQQVAEIERESAPPSRQAFEVYQPNSRLSSQLTNAILEPLLHIGSGAAGKAVGDVAGLAAIPLHAMGVIERQPIDIQQDYINALTYKPRTDIGASPYNPLNVIPNTLAAGIDYIRPEAAPNPLSYSGGLQNAIREAIPQGLSLLGMKYSPPVSGAVQRGAQSIARRLMRSALKPVVEAQKSGAADTAVQTMLDYGINVTPGGVAKLESMLEAAESEIADTLSKSTARVDLGDVMRGANFPAVEHTVTAQGNPLADIAKVRAAQSEFLAHPWWSYNKATGAVDMPIQLAHETKRGTHRFLSGKWGELGEAGTQAQKAIAAGLREQVAKAEPNIALLNAEESRLIPTLNVAERRVLAQMNNNPVGLAALAHDPVAFIGMMADRSSLFKSLMARMVNRVSGFAGKTSGTAAATATLGPLQAISDREEYGPLSQREEPIPPWRAR